MTEIIEYVIHKRSRSPHREGYGGPSCNRAGVKPNTIYTDYDTAILDAKKLTEVNPVGFYVSVRPIETG